MMVFTKRLAGFACVLIVMIAIGAAVGACEDIKAVPALGKLSFELIDNRVFVQATINGQGPFHLIIDTGASLILSPEAAKRSHLNLLASGMTSGVGEGLVPEQRSLVRELTLGPIKLNNIACAILPFADFHPVFGKIPVDGVLGLELFLNYVVVHDYQHRELIFFRPESYTYTGKGEAIHFELEGNIPVINAEFDGISGRFGVDTGARSSLILYGPYVAKNKIVERYKPKFKGVSGWGIGGPVRSYVIRSRSLKIDTLELPGLELVA